MSHLILSAVFHTIYNICRHWQMFCIFHIEHSYLLNTLRLRWKGQHLADDIFKCIFLKENVWISIKISLKFVPKGPINDIPAVVQIMAWCCPGDKPLSEPAVVSLLMHICVSELTIIVSDNGLSPGRHQAIIWTSAGILLIWPLGTKFSEILFEIHTFSLKKMQLKMSSEKWRPFCLGLNVFRRLIWPWLAILGSDFSGETGDLLYWVKLLAHLDNQLISFPSYMTS